MPLTFEQELEQLINRYSKENRSNTPDFILAEYLCRCLENFNQTIASRAAWYGRMDEPGVAPPAELRPDAGPSILQVEEPHGQDQGEGGRGSPAR